MQGARTCSGGGLGQGVGGSLRVLRPSLGKQGGRVDAAAVAHHDHHVQVALDEHHCVRREAVTGEEVGAVGRLQAARIEEALEVLVGCVAGFGGGVVVAGSAVVLELVDPLHQDQSGRLLHPALLIAAGELVLGQALLGGGGIGRAGGDHGRVLGSEVAAAAGGDGGEAAAQRLGENRGQVGGWGCGRHGRGREQGWQEKGQQGAPRKSHVKIKLSDGAPRSPAPGPRASPRNCVPVSRAAPDAARTGC